MRTTLRIFEERLTFLEEEARLAAVRNDQQRP
jgi:hypothetical protein